MTEELKSQIDIGVSSLVEGYQQTPLREFIANLSNYEADNDEQFGRLRVQLQFSDVEVIESTEPYPFPIAQLTVPFSTRRKSQFGFLLSSIDKLIPGGKLSSLINKRARWKYVAENYGRWRGETDDRIVDTLEVVELVGSTSSSKSPYKAALELAAGRKLDNLKEFYQEAFKNPMIKQDKELLSRILNKTFIQEALDSGALEINSEGVLQIVE